MKSINPYEVLSVDPNTDFDEIGAHYNAILEEINSGTYDEAYVIEEASKLLTACNSICNPYERSIIDRTLTKEDYDRISKNANLFRETLKMNYKLEDRVGKEVIVYYSCYDFMTSIKGKLHSVKGFVEIELRRLNIPFISPEIVIHKVEDADTREILYFNPNIPYRKMSKADTLKLISTSFGKSTEQRQKCSKRMLDMTDESSEPKFIDLFLKIKQLYQDQSSEGYIRFIENNTLTAAEYTLLNVFYPDSQNFRFCWDNYPNKDAMYTMKSRENDSF